MTKKKTNKQINKGGRPGVFNTPEKVEQLRQFMRLKPTLVDTANFFQCGTTTIEQAIKKHYQSSFREFRAQNMVQTRYALIRKAIQMGNSGNVPMLIFSLKNLCGWADQPFPEDDESIDGIEWEYGENK